MDYLTNGRCAMKEVTRHVSIRRINSASPGLDRSESHATRGKNTPLLRRSSSPRRRTRTPAGPMGSLCIAGSRSTVSIPTTPPHPGPARLPSTPGLATSPFATGPMRRRPGPSATPARSRHCPANFYGPSRRSSSSTLCDTRRGIWLAEGNFRMPRHPSTIRSLI